MGDTPRAEARKALSEKGANLSMKGASLLFELAPLFEPALRDQQTLSRLLPQAHALEAGQDFLDEIG